MAEITVELIKTLRDKTNAGMMDCKAALAEANGDLEAAETVLRKKGIADADKKAGRDAKEGVIASRILADGKTGILVEVNCETDFVAKNENFREFVEAIISHIADSPSVDSLSELQAQKFSQDSSLTLEEFIKAKVGALGENMGLGRLPVRGLRDRIFTCRAGSVCSWKCSAPRQLPHLRVSSPLL